MCMCAYGHVRIIHHMGLHMCVLDGDICSKSRNWYDILVAPRKTSDRHIELTFIMIAITIGRCILSQKMVLKKTPFCRSPSSENNDEPCPLANGKFRFLPCSVKFSQTTFEVACVLLGKIYRKRMDTMDFQVKYAKKNGVPFKQMQTNPSKLETWSSRWQITWSSLAHWLSMDFSYSAIHIQVTSHEKSGNFHVGSSQWWTIFIAQLLR